jgi:two-component system NtrC family sensor kinase
VDQRNPSCTGCHAQGRKLDQISLRDRVLVRQAAGSHRVLSIITPIPNEPHCSEADCHAHPASIRVLGVLELAMNLEAVDNELTAMQKRIAWRAAVEITVICLLIYFFVRRFISQMELDTPVPIPPHAGEITELARSFDSMRIRLREAVTEINEFTQKLESKVQDRTRELQAAHQKLLQTDRLASLGHLSASVAHEINNPVAGVLNLGMLMQRILKDDGIPPERISDFRRYLGQVVQETTRVGRIVSDLLSFSRRSSPHHAETDINAVVRNTLSLASHKLKLAGIEARLELHDPLPPVLCDRSQLQQVVLNLVLNASEAMLTKQGGEIVVTSGANDGKSVWLRVTDQGEGIPPEILPRIFDPFFTTKPEGKGVGLGLAVTYGIIQAHGGEIDVTSRPGEGTSFLVTLPLRPPRAVQA